MSRGFHRDDVVTLVLKGMRSAAKTWDGLHGTFANQAPEYWFNVHVAKELSKGLENSWVGLEVSARETRQLSKPGKVGRPKKASRENGRVDIVVARDNEKPAAIIEVKSPVYTFNSLEKDVERIASLLADTPNALSVGCIALYTDASHKSRNGAQSGVDGLLELFKTRTAEMCKPKKLKVASDEHSQQHYEDWWGVQCICITRS